jgi:TPR repeat protein
MLLLLSIGVFVFYAATQSSPDEAPAMVSDVASEEPSTVSDAERPSIDSNAVSADASVANCYGSYERENWSAAFVYCAAAAEQGDADAQNFIGWMYVEGKGVAKDGSEAARWYRKAAEQGDANAQYNLGVIYDNGDGVVEDGAEAERWYRKAAEQGDADAQKRLAELGY